MRQMTPETRCLTWALFWAITSPKALFVIMIRVVGEFKVVSLFSESHFLLYRRRYGRVRLLFSWECGLRHALMYCSIMLKSLGPPLWQDVMINLLSRLQFSDDSAYVGEGQPSKSTPSDSFGNESGSDFQRSSSNRASLEFAATSGSITRPEAALWASSSQPSLNWNIQKND